MMILIIYTFLDHEMTQQSRATTKGDIHGPPSSPDHTKLEPLPPPSAIQPSNSRGYVDGDQYIRVDDQGKQMAVKMAKAKANDRTITTIKRPSRFSS